jgi:hypothetical protein
VFLSLSGGKEIDEIALPMSTIARGFINLMGLVLGKNEIIFMWEISKIDFHLIKINWFRY